MGTYTTALVVSGCGRRIVCTLRPPTAYTVMDEAATAHTDRGPVAYSANTRIVDEIWLRRSPLSTPHRRMTLSPDKDHTLSPTLSNCATAGMTPRAPRPRGRLSVFFRDALSYRRMADSVPIHTCDPAATVDIMYDRHCICFDRTYGRADGDLFTLRSSHTRMSRSAPVVHTLFRLETNAMPVTLAECASKADTSDPDCASSTAICLPVVVAQTKRPHGTSAAMIVGQMREVGRSRWPTGGRSE
mmetsp:Transcript_11105/g.35253  ORF Transcript_11105/g.35253 Transcript_11105/m.35253 type:complete len:244 (+) Transcript_11105:3062-3793(+)